MKVVHQCQSISLGKLAFFHYLERVETLRRFWELKHIELKGEQNHHLQSSMSDAPSPPELHLPSSLCSAGIFSTMLHLYSPLLINPPYILCSTVVTNLFNPNP